MPVMQNSKPMYSAHIISHPIAGKIKIKRKHVYRGK